MRRNGCCRRSAPDRAACCLGRLPMLMSASPSRLLVRHGARLLRTCWLRRANSAKARFCAPVNCSTPTRSRWWGRSARFSTDCQKPTRRPFWRSAKRLRGGTPMQPTNSPSRPSTDGCQRAFTRPRNSGPRALRPLWRYVKRSPGKRARSTSTISTAGRSFSACSTIWRMRCAEPREGRRDVSSGTHQGCPMAEKQKFYLTTAISYPNGAPHIGHAYEIIASDAVARFKRIDGFDVYFLTGTDEHGLKIQQAADRSGVTPKALVDEMAGQFKAMADRMGASYDR